MTEKIKDSLQFVTRFYSPGVLLPDDSFIRDGLPFWKRHAVAASIIGAALLAAAAVTTYIALSPDEHQTTRPKQKTEIPVKATEVTSSATSVKKMKFEDASLAEVVQAIEKEYGVKVTGATEGQSRLTLSYEGTAEDLIDAINDLLGTDLRIEK